MTQSERITALIDQLHQRHVDHGTSVRCPVCNAGIGKFCLVDMSKPHASANDIVLHPQRVRAVEAARLLRESDADAAGF